MFLIIFQAKDKYSISYRKTIVNYIIFICTPKEATLHLSMLSQRMYIYFNWQSNNQEACHCGLVGGKEEMGSTGTVTPFCETSSIAQEAACCG
jgi:hypothetical protein